MSFEVVIILALILANGVFAGTELAILGAKRGRLEQQADAGNPGAKAAIKLQDDPNRFLSAVQVGITLIGILTGAFGGARIAGQVAPALQNLPLLGPYASQAAFFFVVLTITYLTLVFGELVPKRIALLKSEAYATLIAPPMMLIARLSSPIVALLSFSTRLVLRLVGLGNAPEARVTEEDIRALVREGAEGGVVEPQEQEIIESLFSLGDRAVRQIMTPRHEIAALDGDATLGDVLDGLLEIGFSRFPVYEENPDHFVGIVHVRDLLRLYRAEGNDALVRAAMSPPIYVPENSRAGLLLATFRKSQRHMALVVSELGSIEGVVTLEDVLEEIVGEIADEYDEAEELAVVRREDGSLLIDGSLPIDDLKEHLEVEELPDEDIYRFDTLAGFVLSLLGHIPKPGDVITWDGWRFEVIDMDGLRIDKVLVSRELASEESQ